MRNIITTCMTIIFLCILTFILLNIYKWKIDSKHTKEVISEIKTIIDTPVKREVSIDFDALLKKNKDTIGYIKINGTSIDYPFVQSKDNNYYLKHSFNKKYNDAGWIFMDYRNNLDDKNIVLYGHDRKDNTMFGTLKNTLKKKWQNNKDNQIITVYLPNEKREYQVFSTYIIKTEDYYITTDFSNTKYSKFINKMKKRSNHDYNVEVTKEDSILTLSTCFTSKDKLVLHAKLIKNSL